MNAPYTPLPRENLRFCPRTGRLNLVHTIPSRRPQRWAGFLLILGSTALVLLAITGAFIPH